MEVTLEKRLGGCLPWASFADTIVDLGGVMGDTTLGRSAIEMVTRMSSFHV